MRSSLIILCLTIFLAGLVLTGFSWLRLNINPLETDSIISEPLLLDDYQAADKSIAPDNPQVAGATTNTDPVFEINKLYLLINAYRKQNKLSPLRTQLNLEASAQEKISDMIEQNYFQHEDQENVQSWYLFRQVGYQYAKAGENLAFGLDTPWQVFTGWVESPTHQEKLLDSRFQDMGLAADCETFAASAEGSCIVVLHLGST
jgi:hypothetical protein